MAKNVCKGLKSFQNWVDISDTTLGYASNAVYEYPSNDPVLKYQTDLQELEQDIRKKLNVNVVVAKVAFRQWEPERQTSIATLRELVKTIRNWEHSANIAQVTGASVGVAGGTMALLGLFLAPFTAGVSMGLTVGGMATGIAGGATSIATTVSKLIADDENVRRMKSILDSDREKTERFHECMRNLVVRVVDLKRIFEITLDALSSVTGLVSICCELRNFRSSIRVFKAFEKSPELVKTAQMLTNSWRGARTAGLTAATAADLAQIKKAFNGWPGAISGTGRLMSGIGTGIMMGVDIFTIVTTSIAIHEGSPSALANAIEENIIAELERELQHYQAIMNELKSVETAEDSVDACRFQ